MMVLRVCNQQSDYSIHPDWGMNIYTKNHRNVSMIQNHKYRCHGGARGNLA